LAHGLGLIVSPRAPLAGGGFEVGREESPESRRIALRNLSPERARLLLPDWLLPFMRADVENNALIASASPFVLDKIERDLQVLDRRRPSVRVQAEVYEVSRRDADSIALNLAFGQRGLPPAPGAPNPSYVPPAFELDGRGVAVVRLDKRREGEGPSWRLALEALRTKGRANLRARPFVTVLSGETGTLFLGQSRFIPVLRSNGGQQDLQALNVPIGYSLRATPRVSVDESKSQEPTPISLSLSPRASTVDEVESGTGLPTLGIREVSTSARLNAGDALLIAGLDVDNLFSTRGRALSQRSAGEKTTLLVVVTAQVV
jgi:type II secretory pathway component GspD/PulD (secretin)